MIEDVHYYDNGYVANEMAWVWHMVDGAQRKMLIAREAGHAIRVADCYVVPGEDVAAATQVFKDILTLRGRWHGP